MENDPKPATASEMTTWAAQALAAVHIAQAIPAVQAEYDFSHADECLRNLWAALNDPDAALAAAEQRGREAERAECLRAALQAGADEPSQITLNAGAEEAYWSGATSSERRIAAAIRKGD